MRRALTLLAALALGAAPLGAGATTVPPLTLTQQARKADVIVRATLGTPTSVKEGEITWLAYPLTVTETVAGDAASLPQREGKPALYLLSGLEGLPELRAGQEAFLLLYSRRLDSPIVGFWQGVYPIENGRVTRPRGSLAPVPPVANAPAPQAATTPGTTSSSTVTTPAASPAASTASAPGSASTASSPTTTPPASAPTGTAPAGTTSGTAAAATTPPQATTTPPATIPAGTTPAATASVPPPPDPNAIETDPAKFRDALRAAREAK